MVSFSQVAEKLSRRGTRKWIGLGFVAIAATRIYYVQEMIAALIIFSVLFLGLAAVVLIIFFLDRASESIATWAAPVVARAGRWFACFVEDVLVWPASARAATQRFMKWQRTGSKKY